VPPHDTLPIEGIVDVHYFGEEAGQSRVMVMTLLGKSLESLFQQKNKKLSIKTVCMLALQMLDRIQTLHDNNYLHRDIKPDNFVMGTGENENLCYLVDMGLVK